MRLTILAPLLLALCAASAPTAFAQVCWLYNPATGGVTIHNNANTSLFAVVLLSGSPGPGQSPTGSAITGTPLQVPGATLDTGDLPLAIAYINFPAGDYFIGNVVTPFTPFADLSVDYYVTPRFPPTRATICPEPATASLAGIGLVAAEMRRRRVRKASLC